MRSLQRAEKQPKSFSASSSEGGYACFRSGRLRLVETALLLSILRLLDLEPLQRAPRHVRRLRVLRHNALVPALDRLAPRHEPIPVQAPGWEDHPGSRP